MDRFQTDSKIGFQFIPSEKLSLVANYSHCQLTSQPALSQGPHQTAAKSALARHVKAADENRREISVEQQKNISVQFTASPAGLSQSFVRVLQILKSMCVPGTLIRPLPPRELVFHSLHQPPTRLLLLKNKRNP